MEPEPNLESCDVRDSERLAVYRYHRRRWLEMLNGEDVHAISDQLRDLLNCDLQFRMILASRQICQRASVGQNGIVH